MSSACFRCRKKQATVLLREEFNPFQLCKACYDTALQAREEGETFSQSQSKRNMSIDGDIDRDLQNNQTNAGFSLPHTSTEVQTWGLQHSELLYFLQNQLDAGTPVDDVACFVGNFYTDEECVEAKELLIRVVCNQQVSDCDAKLPQMKTRIGTNKRENVVMDTIQILLHKVFTGIVPAIRFVAVFAHKVPPVTPTSIDATSLMKQITTVTRQMEEIKRSYVTREELLEAVTGVRANAAPSPVAEEKKRETSVIAPLAKPSYTSVASRGVNKREMECKPKSTPSASTFGNKVPQVGQKGRDGKKVQPRHRQSIIVRGTGESGKAGPLQRSIPRAKTFITRLQPTTLADDIKEYIADVKSLKVDVEKIETKYPSYSSFIITSFSDEQKDLLEPSLWPAGVLVKKYFSRPSRKVPAADNIQIPNQPVTEGVGEKEEATALLSDSNNN